MFSEFTELANAFLGTEKMNVILQQELKHEYHQNRCQMCSLCAVLTILLVEPPQLDLVGFVLGLLLQPTGPGNRGKQSAVILWNKNLCLSIPILHMTLLPCLLVHTESSWRAMREGCISKL